MMTTAATITTASSSSFSSSSSSPSSSSSSSPSVAVDDDDPMYHSVHGSASFVVDCICAQQPKKEQDTRVVLGLFFHHLRLLCLQQHQELLRLAVFHCLHLSERQQQRQSYHHHVMLILVLIIAVLRSPLIFLLVFNRILPLLLR